MAIFCRFCGSSNTRWSPSEAQVCDDCKCWDVDPRRHPVALERYDRLARDPDVMLALEPALIVARHLA